MTTDSYEPAEHYDRVTEAWQLLLGDELHYGVFDTGTESLRAATRALTQRMTDAAQLQAGLSVLDVGCGTGGPARHLARRFGVQVVGITTSAIGVDVARSRAAAAGVTGVSFEQRDGTDNGFDDASFDRVWVLESSHLMRDRLRLMSECARVLRPGGRLVWCDLIRHREIPFTEVRARRADFATLRTAFGDAHFEPLDFCLTTARNSGFEIELAVDLTDVTLPTFDRWRANAKQHRDAVTQALGQAGWEAFVRSCDILESLWLDGTFGYGLLAATRSSA